MAKELIIPSSPDDLNKLKAGIHEIANSMLRADSEREYQKESAEDLAEKTGVDKKYITRMARDFHKKSSMRKLLRWMITRSCMSLFCFVVMLLQVKRITTANNC